MTKVWVRVLKAQYVQASRKCEPILLSYLDNAALIIGIVVLALILLLATSMYLLYKYRKKKNMKDEDAELDEGAGQQSTESGASIDPDASSVNIPEESNMKQ